MSIRSLLPFVLIALAACSHQDRTSSTTTQTSTTLPKSLRLDAAPTGASSVLDLRNTTPDGAEVVVTGRAKDFVATRAVFTIADMSLKLCSAPDSPMPECKTPWDYCCTDIRTLTEASATIEVHDGDAIAAGSVQGWNGLDHLKQVFVRGKLKKDAKGNLGVIADGIFVQP